MSALDNRARSAVVDQWTRLQGSLIVGTLVVMVAGPVAAVGAVRLLASMWASCDVGVNDSVNGMGLLFIDLPVLLVLLAVVMLPTYGLVAMWKVPVAVVVAVALAVAVVWVYLAINHNPGGDYPAPFCPDNIPPWWPGWIPL